MLQGEDGQQRKELASLIDWLASEMRPDVVHLSNSLLVGLAGPIREALRVPVLCTLQGEDLFLEELGEPPTPRCAGCSSKPAATSMPSWRTSHFYAAAMAEYLAVPRESIHVVRLGLHTDEAAPEPARLPERPFVVGYLARICPEKGLHLLADAFRDLARGVAPGAARLRVAGYLSERDRVYKEGIFAQLRAWGLAPLVDDVGRGRSGREDRVPAHAARAVRADDVPRAQGSVRARGAGRGRAGGASHATAHSPS